MQVMDKVCYALSTNKHAEEDLRQALIEEDDSGFGYVTKQQLQVCSAAAAVISLAFIHTYKSFMNMSKDLRAFAIKECSAEMLGWNEFSSPCPSTLT